MSHEIIMPALGMSQDTGTLLAWHKAEGEAVTQGEILFEVETDKSTVEVEAPADGFLVGVSAEAGAEVPVGNVIAYIRDTADAVETASTSSATAPTASSNEESLPEGQTVIMPTLGMSQDTGLLVNWAKEPGEAVEAEDVLFEVETDKSVVEVPAGHSGFLVARLAAAGDEVPTGDTIAIISATAVANPIDRAYSKGAVPVAAAVEADPSPSPDASVQAPAKAPVSAPAKAVAHVTAPEGRVLASPKLRRLAHQAGLDLHKLAASGHPQPFHARDFDALKQANLAQPVNQLAVGGTVHRLVASVEAQPITDLVSWLKTSGYEISMPQILAGFAGASFGVGSHILVETLKGSTTYLSAHQLSDTTEVEANHDFVVRDMRGSFLQEAHFSNEATPVVVLTSNAQHVSVTLTYSDSQITTVEACALLNEFAGRLQDPIRHLF